MTPMFNTKKAVRSKTTPMQERFVRALLLVLNELGNELVRYARLTHSYTDRTGNLTNSMGYAVIRGKTVVMTGGELQDGEALEAAIKAAYNAAKRSTTAYSLVVVAGMEYAAYVEAKGYNVLVPAELKAKKEFQPRMRHLLIKYDAKLHEMLKAA